jgi:hypothetical protein
VSEPRERLLADSLRGVIVDVADDGSCVDFLFTAG